MAKDKKNWCFYSFSILIFWTIVALVAIVWLAMNAPKMVQGIEDELSKAVTNTTEAAADSMAADMANNLEQISQDITADVTEAVTESLKGFSPANVEEQVQDAANATNSIISGLF